MAAALAVATAVLLTSLQVLSRDPGLLSGSPASSPPASSRPSTPKPAAKPTAAPRTTRKGSERTSKDESKAEPTPKPKPKTPSSATKAPAASASGGAASTLRTQFLDSARTWSASLAAYKAAQTGDWELRQRQMMGFLKASLSFQRTVRELQVPTRLADERNALLRDLKSLEAALRMGTARVSLGDGLSPPTLIRRAASTTAGSLRAFKAGLPA